MLILILIELIIGIIILSRKTENNTILWILFIIVGIINIIDAIIN